MRKPKSVIMHCKKLSTSQISFYSVWIWTLSTPCFHRLIGEIVTHKDFPLKFSHKKVFLWQFYKIKRKFLSVDWLFIYQNKMILVHCTLNFWPSNPKEEINFTLPYKEICMDAVLDIFALTNNILCSNIVSSGIFILCR